MFRRLTKRFFILVNLFVAILFLIGCYGGRWPSSSLWFTGFFTLAAPYLLLALVVFLLFWLFTRPAWLLISLISIGIAYQPVRNLVALRMAPNFTMKKHPAHLRVMCWNVELFKIAEFKKQPQLKQQMINVINAYNPDIACFQEMVGSDFDTAAINYLPEIMESLKMKDYHYAYNPKLNFDSKHRFGIIILSKYPLESKHTISYEPYDYNSIFEYVDVKKDSNTFRIFNVHLQSLRLSNENLQYIDEPSKKATVKESRNILLKLRQGFQKRILQSNRIANEIAKSPHPVVVCGDFNDVPNSYAYTHIRGNLKDAFTEKGTGLGRTYISIAPTLRIDNIFTDNRISIEQFTREKKKISDHYPIIADLYLHSQ